MSRESWHNYGYGIRTDQIELELDSTERLENLLSLAPKYQSEIHDYFKEVGISEPSVSDYLEYDEDYYLRLSTLLKEVISEAEGIDLVACDDYECSRFLIFEPLYPWQMTEKEKDLTEETLKQLFQKYVSVLTEKPFEFGYQAVENGSY